ncbi:MAG TPA: MG2 domain-containing protein [Anseongella sp.]
MKKTRTFLFFGAIMLVGLFAGSAMAQQISQDSLIQQKLLTPYTKYFEFPAEGIYTHFNKNAYMTGEGVWFKVYLLDVGGKRPFDLAQNVYAELFDPFGKEVDKQVLFAEKGSASGMFHLADSLAPGTYTFRAYTNWMRNMDQHAFYTHTFEVSGGISKPNSGSRAGAYDIQFFAEGGTLLEGIPNSVAFKIVNPQGKGE